MLATFVLPFRLCVPTRPPYWRPTLHLCLLDSMAVGVLPRRDFMPSIRSIGSVHHSADISIRISMHRTSWAFNTPDRSEWIPVVGPQEGFACIIMRYPFKGRLISQSKTCQ